MQEKTASKDIIPSGEAFAFSNPKALERLFKQHYTELCNYSFRYVKQAEIAEEIVQDLFVHLWQKEVPLSVHSSVKAYLFTSVRNRSVNYLKSQFARQKFESDGNHQAGMLTDNTRETLEYEELWKLVQEAIAKLPPQCRIIFEMSRFGGFSYQEIADELQLSPKTIENQMGIGLKKLKEYLRSSWDLLLVLLAIISQNESINGYF